MVENVAAGVISGVLTALVIAAGTWLVIRYRNRASWRLVPQVGRLWVIENITKRTLHDVIATITAPDMTSRHQEHEFPVDPGDPFGLGEVDQGDTVYVTWRDGKNYWAATQRINEGVYDYRLRGSAPTH